MPLNTLASMLASARKEAPLTNPRRVMSTMLSLSFCLFGDCLSGAFRSSLMYAGTRG